MKRLAIATLALLIPAGTAFGHHPFNTEFDAKKPVTMTGHVTKLDWVAPHVMIHADVMEKNGESKNIAFEAASPALLAKRGLTKNMLKDGSEITIHGYMSKTDNDRIAARTLTMADGKKFSAAPSDGGPKA